MCSLPRNALLVAVVAWVVPSHAAAITLPGPFDDSGAVTTLVENGDFESGSPGWLPDDWAGHAWWEWSTAEPYEGAASAVMDDPNFTNTGAGIAMWQSAPVNSSTAYVVSAYVLNDLLGGGNAYIDLHDAAVLLPSGNLGDCHGISTSGEGAWEFVYCLFTTTASQTSLSVRTVVDGTIFAGSFAAFDEFALTLAADFVPPLSLGLDSDGDGVTIADGDCDDLDPVVFPGNPEVCDGGDNDCDGAPGPDEVDADGDGWLACAECDDGTSAVHPGAVEADPLSCADGVDNDCDGLVDAFDPDCPTPPGDDDDTGPDDDDASGDDDSADDDDSASDDDDAVPDDDDSGSDDDDSTPDDDDSGSDDDDSMPDDDDSGADDDDAVPDDDDSGSDDDGPEDDDDAGEVVAGASDVPDCGCAAGGRSPAGSWLLILPPLLARRRRRALARWGRRRAPARPAGS